MAVYDANLNKLTTLLGGLSSSTSNAVSEALTVAGLMPTARLALPVEVVTPPSAGGTIDAPVVDAANNPISLFIVGAPESTPNSGPNLLSAAPHLVGADNNISSPTVDISPTTQGNIIVTTDSSVTVVDQGQGDDTLIAGNGATVQVLHGNNTLSGALTAGSYSTMIGGGGADSITAGAGNAVIDGGQTSTSTDTLWAGSGNTTINIAMGYSTIRGATAGGFSTINIAGGANSITGAGGTDRVAISTSALMNGTTDTITGSSQSLTNVFISANSGAAKITSAANGYTDIKFGTGADLEVKNVTIHFSNASGRFSLTE